MKRNEALTWLFTVVDEVLEAFAPAPLAKAGKIVVHAADDLVHEFERDGSHTMTVAARETAAGESANKAAKLAGMREAVFKIINNMFDNDEEAGYCANAIMAEIARRL